MATEQIDTIKIKCVVVQNAIRQEKKENKKKRNDCHYHSTLFFSLTLSHTYTHNLLLRPFMNRCDFIVTHLSKGHFYLRPSALNEIMTSRIARTHKSNHTGTHYISPYWSSSMSNSTTRNCDARYTFLRLLETKYLTRTNPV